MSDLQYCPHCNSYHPASTSMTGCMRAPMAVTSGRHIVPPSLFLDQIEYVTRAEAAALAEAKRLPEVKALVEALTLAANRLQRLAVEFVPGSHNFITVGEWEDEARAALKGVK